MRHQLIFELPGARKQVTINALTAEQMDMLHGVRKDKRIIDMMGQRLIPEALGIPYETYRKFLEGDETASVIALRRVTWGDKYIYETRCTDKDCGRSFPKEVNLAELPVKSLHPAQPLEGLEYDVYDKEGTLVETIVFKLPRVYERIQMEKELEELAKENPEEINFYRSYSAAMRITDVVSVKETSDGPKRISRVGSLQGFERRQWFRNYVRKMSFAELQEFMEAVEDVSCGVDNEIHYKCPYCYHEWDDVMELNKGFFSSTEPTSDSQKSSSRRSRVRKTWLQSSPSEIAPQQPPSASLESSEDLETQIPSPSTGTPSPSSSPESSSDSPSSSAPVPLSSPIPKSG